MFPKHETSNKVDSYALIRGISPPSKLTVEKDSRSKHHHVFPDENPSGEAVRHCVGMWVAGHFRFQSKIPRVESLGPIYLTGPRVEGEVDESLDESITGMRLRQRLRDMVR